MKKKVNILEKLSSGKGFYITSGVCFILIIAAIAVIYNSSVKILKNIAPETTVRVEKNKDDVKDPRKYSKEELTDIKQETVPTKKPSNNTTEERSTVYEGTKMESTFKFDKDFTRPSKGKLLKAFSSSPVFDKTMEDWRSHGGADYEAGEDGCFYSVGKGVVKKVISDTSYGYILEIDHGAFLGRYCGLKQGTTPKIGDIVEKGQKLGEAGEIPCEKNDGAHLHFEILLDGDRIDPESKFQGN